MAKRLGVSGRRDVTPTRHRPLLALHLNDLKAALSYGVDWALVIVIIFFLGLAVQIAYSATAGVIWMHDMSQ